MPSANVVGDFGDDPSRRDLQTPLLSTESLPVPEPYLEVSEKLSIDDMLQKYCGEFGRWQLTHFLLTSLAWALEAFHTMVMIFADNQPTWRCVGPPRSCPFPSGKAVDVCGMNPANWEWVGGGRSSTVAEWGLVCGDKYKVGLVQAMFFSGCMVGAGVFGHLSDSWLGRRGSLITVCILNSIFGILTAFSPSYNFYAVLRLITGFSTGGVGLCAFVLATEPVGPSRRGVAGMSTFYFFAGGIGLLSGIAYAFPSWRLLYIASSFPSILFVLAIIPFISESPRWFIVRGRFGDAMKVMHDIASTNGMILPPGVKLAIDGEPGCNSSRGSGIGSAIFNSFTAGYNNNNNNRNQMAESTLIDVMKSRVTRKRLILAVAINFLLSVVYYGLSLNVVNLETNLYLNVLLNSIAEMPAFIITAMLLDRFGRRPLTIGTMWFSGIFCLLGTFLSEQGAWKQVRMLCGVAGIFGMAGTYNLVFIYTSELFPTVVRNAALGSATQAAQMGAILAPFIVVLGGIVPFAVFGCCGVLGGILAFHLPETMNRPLYDTLAGMEEAENGRSNSNLL